MHRGFTMVEILTVVGILALLAGLIAVGFNVLGSSQERRTRVAIEAAMGMQAEYENSTKLTGGLLTCSVNASAFESDTTTPANVCIFEPAVAIMDKLLKVPANQSAMEKVDASNVKSMTVLIAAGAVVNTYSGDQSLTKPLLLDGWQKPLVYVGSGGLTHLKADPDGAKFWYGPTGGMPSGYTQKAASVTAPNGRPFWVSAGKDGNFETHDDNIYSFEN